MAASPTVVLVPMWAPGHFASMLEAGKRLLLCSGAALSLTVLVMPPPADSAASDVTVQIDREATTTAASPGGHAISFHRLPAVDHGRDDPVHPSEYIALYTRHVRDAVAGVSVPVAAVVVDLFGTMLLDELAVPGYVYFTSTAALLALMLRLPSSRAEVSAAFRRGEADGAAVDVPGLPAPVPAASMPSPEVNDYDWFAYHGRRFAESGTCRGVIVNTVAELEPGVLAAIAGGRCTPGRTPPAVYPVGPVLSLRPRADDGHPCLRWLDARAPASVAFICFGSMGWLPAERARAVAAGLERSGHSFLWVLRGPPSSSSSRYPTDADLGALLPDGFLDRTEGAGLVWPSWAPQAEVLAHAAVGGFVTHCGWNSALESLWHGVPMAPCPLYAEQPLNAFELVAAMGVAVGQLGLAGVDAAAEVERAVRSLMGGATEVREKAVAAKAACRKAVEKGGSSYAAAQRVVQDMLATYAPK